MHSATVLLLVAALVGFAASNPAKSVAYRGHKVLSITPKNPEELELLKGLEANEDLSLDFWTDPVAVGKEVGETKNFLFYDFFPILLDISLKLLSGGCYPCPFSLPLLIATSPRHVSLPLLSGGHSRSQTVLLLINIPFTFFSPRVVFCLFKGAIIPKLIQPCILYTV